MAATPHHTRAVVALTAALVAAAVGATLTGAPAGAIDGTVAPAAGVTASAVKASVVKASARSSAGRYIVMVRPGSSPAAVVRAHDDQLAEVTLFRRAIRGFAATFDAATRARLAADPRVRAIVADGVVTTADETAAVEAPLTEATQVVPSARALQLSPPSWGLDRIDQRDLPLSSTFELDATGSGVTAYVVDTGIRADHTAFGGRVHPGAYSVNDGNLSGDCDGHGTHVAGTLGGSTFGVARAVTLVPVRVLDCRGYGLISSVLAGLDWVIADHDAGEPAVVNMSLGVARSPVVDAAVAAAVDDGMVVVVAAGNDGMDACLTSPAAAPSVITVAASTSSDALATFSNRGTCVDLIAPGVGIVSAGIDSPTATATMKGTSMATPHVAGVAALMLSADPTATPAEIADRLLADATIGKVSGAVISGTPDRLLYLADDVVEAVPPRVPPAPAAAPVPLDSRGFSPADALPAPFGAWLIGDTSACITSCGPQYWQLAEPILPGDDVRVAWTAATDTGMCLSSGAPLAELCDLSAPVTLAGGEGAVSRLRIPYTGTTPIAPVYLVFDPVAAAGVYSFSWDGLAHLVHVRVRQPLRPPSPTKGSVVVTARLVDGSPVPDGTEVRLAIRAPGIRAMQSGLTVDGRVRIPLALPSSLRGATVTLRATVRATEDLRLGRSPRTTITLRR